ncbi:tetratricopeptide repeat-containing sulfotransferase family protein [Oceanicoccus sagamiensis]|uniref:Uncharacterized protein n=1 Tax=Oceanicoccus sagamiensis TaxID=716816 RepID=A0A1X9N8N6_9GAMM|nr:sulfotransferase family protein [Oceanicoccus sagamiensis]ARN72802.1 hypothetical protein BST96_00960 [Oceanicoccus sagamiensis]
MNKKKRFKRITISLSENTAPVDVVYVEAVEQLKHAFASGSYDNALYIASQLLAIENKDPEVHIAQLRCLVALGRIQEAQVPANILADKFSTDAIAMFSLAKYYISCQDQEKARALLEKVVVMRPKYSDAWVELGICYALMGNKSQATQSYQKAIKINPDNISGYYQLAHLNRESIESSHIDRMQDMAANTDLSLPEKINLNFALAWSYQGKNIAEEMNYLKAANTLMAEFRPWDKSTWAAMEDAYFGMLDGEDITAMQSVSTLDDQPIFIIAMPRSGTTLVERILSAHTQTYGIGESSAFFNANGLASTRIQQELIEDEDLMFKRYLQVMDEAFKSQASVNAADGLRIIDKSMNNELLVGFIVLTYPGAKIIHLKRDPMDVCLSCYQQLFPFGQEFSYDLADCANYYLEHDRVMERWKQLFPDKILNLSYEDLVAGQAQQTERLLDFCGLPWEDSCMEFHNKKANVYTASYAQVDQKIYQTSINRSEKYAELLQPALAVLNKGS